MGKGREGPAIFLYLFIVNQRGCPYVTQYTAREGLHRSFSSKLGKQGRMRALLEVILESIRPESLTVNYEIRMGKSTERVSTTERPSTRVAKYK